MPPAGAHENRGAFDFLLDRSQSAIAPTWTWSCLWIRRPRPLPGMHNSDTSSSTDHRRMWHRLIRSVARYNRHLLRAAIRAKECWNYAN